MAVMPMDSRNAAVRSCRSLAIPPVNAILERYLRAALTEAVPDEPRHLRKRLRLLAQLLRAAPPRTSAAAGRVLWCDSTGCVFALEIGQHLVVGRADGCHVRFRGPQVSQRHYRIWPQDESWWIEDLGSTNGTHVNGQPVQAPRALRPGDLVEAGGTAVFLDLPG
jgi:hypothetical protein